jgi:hypothetical protein
MFKVYAADKDNELLNYIGEYKTLRGAKNAYGKERNARDGFCHGKITDDYGYDYN